MINRMRSTLGWSERDLAGMVEGFTRLTGLHFLPEDRAVVNPEPGPARLVRITQKRC